MYGNAQSNARDTSNSPSVAHSTRPGMTARYRRLAQSEPEEEEQNKKLQAQNIETITAKLHALIWVSLAALLAYFTELTTLVMSDRINRPAWSLAVVCISAVVVIFIYLGFWLPIVMKNTAPWDIYCPNMVPASTAFCVVGFISSIVAFWPVWGLLSPLFVSFLTMGVVFSAHFVPWPF